jgi:hypothetical protein
MDADRIRSMLKPDKFHAFDVRTASGNSYRVRSPETGWISPEDDVMLVYDPDQGASLIDVDQVVECVRPIIKGRGKGDRRREGDA